MAGEAQSESSSRLSSKQWERIGELLQSALEREPEERVPFLSGACGDDVPLLREVRSLLSSSEKAGDFIERPELNVPAMAAALGLHGAEAGLKAGTVIGRYRIVRRIGQGGMGAVYEAEQENPRRTVALKFINQGLVSSDQLRRFERESQALGRLQHSGIAQIYEAGTAEFGHGPQPYFAMELIRGETLREYADQHRLSIRERLEMMARICDAVHHAHQRGLIHRDLKPDNILVDNSGQPKVLDFGVARMTNDDTKATLSGTGDGQLLGTLPYMSPEQALADPLEVDTRSDVYALGVILYELLSARLPYPLSEKMHEALQTIREQDPARLSSINREYRGDIETIVAKALEKDKARRYASASELEADIRRHLRDEPIMARPPSAAYQLQKFARRHKALVAGTAAVFVVLMVEAVIATLLYMTQSPGKYAEARTWFGFSSSSTSTHMPRQTPEKKAITVAISPDGQWVVFSQDRRGQQYRMVTLERRRPKIPLRRTNLHLDARADGIRFGWPELQGREMKGQPLNWSSFTSPYTFGFRREPECSQFTQGHGGQSKTDKTLFCVPQA
jgi:serine/threonine protein kinase